jgi:hypothetical protein
MCEIVCITLYKEPDKKRRKANILLNVPLKSIPKIELASALIAFQRKSDKGNKRNESNQLLTIKEVRSVDGGEQYRRRRSKEQKYRANIECARRRRRRKRKTT